MVSAAGRRRGEKKGGGYGGICVLADAR